MRTSVFVLLISTGISLAATNDPVKDFLQKTPPYIREAGKFYSDDRVLRLDLDLNNDGQLETLVSLARDRDGKQGNIWAVYQARPEGSIEVGNMTFSPSRFYLGNIDEINRYGLVTFGPSGGGEGVLRAYLFDGSSIEETQIGAVTRDQQTRQLTGNAPLKKYLGEEATLGDDIVIVIDADQLAHKYGVAVQPRTYREAVQELLTAQNTAGAQSPAAQALPTATPSTPPPTAALLASSPVPALAATPTATSIINQRTPVWPWILGIPALIALAALVLKLRRFAGMRKK